MAKITLNFDFARFRRRKDGLWKRWKRLAPYYTPISIFAGAVLISLSVLYTGGAFAGLGLPTFKIAKKDAGTTPPPPAGQPALGAGTGATVQVSGDDDAVIGDSNAPVTLVEFVDYECPFCKRHFEETHGQLVENYVKKGLLKIVMRDLPLSFHDPAATKEALAAECAGEFGDDKYFSYHDEIFARTSSNGQGMPEAGFAEAAQKLGLNVSTFNSCLSSEKYKEEVQNDLAAATAYGATGTPSFFVGLSSPDGIIDGKIIVGALPYSAFQTEIDSLLE